MKNSNDSWSTYADLIYLQIATTLSLFMGFTPCLFLQETMHFLIPDEVTEQSFWKIRINLSLLN